MKKKILFILLIVILFSLCGCQSEGADATSLLFTFDVNEEEEKKIYDTDLFHYELSVQVLPSENDEEVLLSIEYSEQKTDLHSSRLNQNAKLGLDLDFENIPEYELEHNAPENEGACGSNSTYTYSFEVTIPSNTEVLYLHATDWDMQDYDKSAEADLNKFKIEYPGEGSSGGVLVRFSCSGKIYNVNQQATLIVGDTEIIETASGMKTSDGEVWTAVYDFELPDGMTELVEGEYKIILVGGYLRIDPVVFEIHL